MVAYEENRSRAPDRFDCGDGTCVQAISESPSLQLSPPLQAGACAPEPLQVRSEALRSGPPAAVYPDSDALHPAQVRRPCRDARSDPDRASSVEDFILVSGDPS